MATNKSVLMCTVGGAHQPILDAIRSVNPEYVCFFCTGTDARTGQLGSVGQITQPGNVMHAKPPGIAAAGRMQAASDLLRQEDAKSALKELEKKDKPTLPNIPTQAMLGDDQFGYVIVPADDLDEAVRTMRDEVIRLLGKYPNRPIKANYTGGTKTMTAALVLVALEFDEIELQLVGGVRSDLTAVKDGTERTAGASVSALRLRQAMAPCRDAWRRFGYQEAAAGLRDIRANVDTQGFELLQLSRTLSEALSRWDRFDHQGARDMLQTYGGLVKEQYPDLLWMVNALTTQGPKRQPAYLFDLWLNAERRAKQGRYDDAVARWYRMVEWMAQWQIKEQLGFETKEFPCDHLPDDIDGKASCEGEVTKVGLSAAWKIIAAKCRGACQAFGECEAASLRSHLEKRNHSILAHGFRPVSHTDWHQLEQWTRDRFLPMLREHAGEVGLRKEWSQLPTEPPEI